MSKKRLFAYIVWQNLLKWHFIAIIPSWKSRLCNTEQCTVQKSQRTSLKVWSKPSFMVFFTPGVFLVMWTSLLWNDRYYCRYVRSVGERMEGTTYAGKNPHGTDKLQIASLHRPFIQSIHFLQESSVMLINTSWCGLYGPVRDRERNIDVTQVSFSQHSMHCMYNVH